MTKPDKRPEGARPAYVPFEEATDETYANLGFRCGLEVHQQLTTEKKLFCRCPAGRYQQAADFDAQLVRHMRPTLSELGEYDGTALMEFRTKKNIVYRIKGETACTYDIDDTPPFPLNRDALKIAVEIALLLGSRIVGELHITRKQYLDGSIPTGFQRTAIVGIEGEIPIRAHPVRIIQLSVEEDSCREVSDIGHDRVYMTDRLGMPLIETVTYPDMRTPAEAAEAAQYIRYLARSTGKVNTGIGAAREDVNVSIDGGTRVEIKGVQHIRQIPRLTHNEAFRQNALLGIQDELLTRIDDPATWMPRHTMIHGSLALQLRRELGLEDEVELVAMSLPGFAGLSQAFTSPGRCFIDEISDRLKVIACIEKPNLASSERMELPIPEDLWEELEHELEATDCDTLLLLWGAHTDMPTAVETVEERCRWAFDGVPNETRKALPDGTTMFERVLPGPDRMYPDTDSAPIPIGEDTIEAARSNAPEHSVAEAVDQMSAWRIPADAHPFILRQNLYPTLRHLVDDLALDPQFAGTLLGHTLRRCWFMHDVPAERLVWLVGQAQSRSLALDLLKTLVPLAWAHVEADFDALLDRAGYRPHTDAEIRQRIDKLKNALIAPSLPLRRRVDFVMGGVRPLALGNVPLARLASDVEEAVR